MIKKNSELELSVLNKAEMDIIKGGVQSSIGACDICHISKYEKAKRELAENSPTLPTRPTDVTLL